MTFYKPLTPAFRSDITDGIHKKHDRVKRLSAERLSQYTENRADPVRKVNKRTS